MRLNVRKSAAAIFLITAFSAAALADDRTDYNKRVAERLVALFESLDRDADGVVTREDTRGDVNFDPRFADMDINSDGNVTRQELQRYNAHPYGARLGPR